MWAQHLLRIPKIFSIATFHKVLYFKDSFMLQNMAFSSRNTNPILWMKSAAVKLIVLHRRKSFQWTFKFYFYFSVCVGVLPVCVPVYLSRGGQKNASDVSWSPSGCWELSLWRRPSALCCSALSSSHPRNSWLAAASEPLTCDNCILPTRNCGIHYGRRAQFLFHGDEHKAASGASCHRNDHRSWLGGMAVQGEKVCLVTNSLGLWVELRGRVLA